MHILHLILLWIVPTLWLVRLLEAAHGLPSIPNLTEPLHDLTPMGDPTVTIIVPARNEAADITACLQSLLAQDYPHLRILAVNDRSTDTTGALMDSLAGPTLSVLHIETLPAGWLGKTHAMARAAQEVERLHPTDFLLFTDADVLFEPTSIRRTLAHAQATQADHLVLAPTTIIRRWDEAALLAFIQIFGLWAVRPWKVADSNARDAIGIGAFNLIRRTAYDRIGGFPALRMQVVEDLALARRVKQLGLRQRFAYGRNLVNVHWASGVPGLINVMTKNIFSVFNYHPALLLVACVWLGAFCILPFAGVFIPAYCVPAACTVACFVGAYGLYWRVTGLAVWNAVLAPFAATVLIFVLMRSMITTLRQGGVEWRGTFYSLAELRKNAAPLLLKRLDAS